jgi:hypothetical protein
MEREKKIDEERNNNDEPSTFVKILNIIRCRTNKT